MFKLYTCIASVVLIVTSMNAGLTAGAEVGAMQMTMPGGMTQPTPMKDGLQCLGNCLLRSNSLSATRVLRQCAEKCNVDLN